MTSSRPRRDRGRARVAPQTRPDSAGPDVVHVDRLQADYGFVPDTLGEDGDPIDALVLLDEPTFPPRHEHPPHSRERDLPDGHASWPVGSMVRPGVAPAFGC